MAQINFRTKTNPIYTHEGAKAKNISPKVQLERTLMSCMLWEDTFYEDGVSIADRLKELVFKVDPSDAVRLAIAAREDMKIRHAPLLVARYLAKKISSLKNSKYTNTVETLLERIIQRADELAEFIAIYWKDGKEPLSAQVKRGLAKAFEKFDEYQLAKYNRNNSITLRDVMFLTHPTPCDNEQKLIWGKLAYNTLPSPDTWEVSLSAGKDKKETFTRLLVENKLGAMALLRNLRNMITSGVDMALIKKSILKMNTKRVLPFRFITAAKYAPDLESELEQTLFSCLEDKATFIGKTVILVDVSGSMFYGNISGKSEVNCVDAASGLAILLRELCEEPLIYSFSDNISKVPARRGFALRDAIRNAPSGGTNLGKAIRYLNYTVEYDRIIVVTDEQSHDVVPSPRKNSLGYMINVQPYANGVGYGNWLHIDGWSEVIIDYIQKYEEFLKRKFSRKYTFETDKEYLVHLGVIPY